MVLFRIICDLVALCTLGTYIYFLIATHRENKKIFGILSKKITHLYHLTDILCDSCFSLPHRALYSQIRNLGPFNMPKTKREEFEIMRKTAFEGYSENRKKIIDIINSTEDPTEKERHEQKLRNMDSIFNLMGTIDEKSSEEYIQSVLTDIKASIFKIVSSDNESL
jgi:hypothetical protein